MDRQIQKKTWTVKNVAKFGIPALFFGAVIYLLIFGDRSSKLNVELEKITVSTVQKGEFQEFIPVTGRVEPFETYFLSASEGGMVEERILESGTPVEKGEAIVKLTNTNLLMTILNNEAQVNRASNDLRSTRLMMEQNRLQLKTQLARQRYDLLTRERSFKRSKELFEKGFISSEEFELARDEYDYSREGHLLTIESMKQDSLFRLNQVQQLELSLEQMHSNLFIVRQKQDNLTIRAPITGTLTSLDAEIGDTKNPGENIGQIDVLDRFRVRAEIDEHYIARVETGRYATFDFAGQTYQLMVTKVYMEVTNNRFEVDLEFVNTQAEGVRRGQTLHMRLELGDLSEELLVPRGGWYQKTGGQWIYVIDPSGGFAVKRDIRVGRYNPRVYTVLEGLQQDEKVITSSYDSFGDIDKLILKD